MPGSDRHLGALFCSNVGCIACKRKVLCEGRTRGASCHTCAIRMSLSKYSSASVPYSRADAHK